MATALNRQVSAYRDSVTEASGLAVACWDSHKPIQEAVLMAPGVVAAIVAVLDAQKFDSKQELRDWICQCEDMLRSMTSVMKTADTLLEHNFQVAGLVELRAAMAAMRFALADLLDAESSEPGPSEPTAAGTSPEKFAALANDLPPPSSWYEENFDGLRGPKSGRE